MRWINVLYTYRILLAVARALGMLKNVLTNYSRYTSDFMNYWLDFGLERIIIFILFFSVALCRY